MSEEILNSQNLVILKTPENKILEWTFLEEKDFKCDIENATNVHICKEWRIDHDD